MDPFNKGLGGEEDQHALTLSLKKNLHPTQFPSVDDETDGKQKDGDSTNKKKSGGFQSMGFASNLLKAITKKGYNCPTPIQRKAIPILMNGRDIIAMARTGSGKTAAFLLPMLHHLGTHSGTVGVRGIVLSPTRELALQTCRFARELGRYTGLKYCLVVGGSSLEEQFTDLAANPDIVIATPGRLLHIMHESRLELKLVKMVVMDEGDRLFELGFQAQIMEILKSVPESCQRTLFSATMPEVLAEFASAGLTNPVLVRLDTDIRISEDLKLSFFVIREDERLSLLLYLLDEVIHVRNMGASDVACQVAVFVATKYHVEFLQGFLAECGIQSSVVHGTMDQEARKESISSFYKKKTAVLIVTDVAARGLDIPQLDYVINYAFPSTEKLFIHRVGRVARAGRSGTAFSFVGHDEVAYVMDLHLGLNRTLKMDIENGDLPKDVNYIGSMPPELLRRHADVVRRVLIGNAELQQFEKTADNGNKQYKRTRNPASQVSQSKTKAFLASLKIHPEVASLVNAVETQRLHAIQELGTFRGGGTIFQIHDGRNCADAHKEKFEQSRKFIEHAQKVKEKVADQKRRAQELAEKEAAGGKAELSDAAVAALPLSQRLVLRSKLRRDDGVNLLPAAATVGSLSQQRNADSEYFIPYVSDRQKEAVEDVEGAQDLRDVVLDVNADTLEGIQTKRAVYTWNKKTKKYTKQNLEQTKLLMRGLKNEAGSKVKIKTDHKTYQKWAERTKLRIQGIGEEEDGRAVRKAHKRLRGGPEPGDDVAEDRAVNPPQRKQPGGGGGGGGKKKKGRQSMEEIAQNRLLKSQAKIQSRKYRKFNRD